MNCTHCGEARTITTKCDKHKISACQKCGRHFAGTVKCGEEKTN